MKKVMKQEEKTLAIFQAKNGAIELKKDFDNENFWANKKDIAQIFGIDRSVVSRHIKNIFNDEELDKNMVCAKFAHTTKHGSLKGKTQTTEVEFYNLDIILAVGYKTNSVKAIEFRKWATKTLKQHITQGYTINENFLQKKKNLYEKVLEDIQLLSEKNNILENSQIINLIKSFSSTWFTLENYDKQNFPKKGEQKTMQEIDFNGLSKNLYEEISFLKQELLQKKEATELFAQEKNKGSLNGILGNVFQSVFGQDAYETTEEKAVHLLYFIIKNHPFNDGNKRTGAFSFIWILQKFNFDFTKKITPETLTILTLLIAESNPKEKDKMIGLVLLLLKK
jgi:death-on-curing family protein